MENISHVLVLTAAQNPLSPPTEQPPRAEDALAPLLGGIALQQSAARGRYTSLGSQPSP